MSIAVLNQVYDETRRLAIAGSSVASGDFRLKKLVPPLEQAGQKAPVFAKVAQAVSKLIDSTEKTSAEALLELSTLVNAILYTQGETGMEGTLEPIQTTDLGRPTTQMTARMLKPLLEALTTTGSGRMEIVKDAHERGAFADLRLFGPALAALDDPYPEIADFISQKILPLYGKAILPELKAKFHHKGRGGNVRRLSLMCQLDPAGAREYVKLALDEGSREMKVAALACLGDSSEDLAYLLDQVKAKAREVRVSALTGLSKSSSPEATAALRAALESSDGGMAIDPIRRSKEPAVRAFVLELAQSQLDALLAGKEKDKAKVGKQAQKLIWTLECLKRRDDPETIGFLLHGFGQRDKLTTIKSEPSGNDVIDSIVVLMAAGPAQTRHALVAAHGTLTAEQLGHAFLAALKLGKPAEVFDTFSPYLAAKGSKRKKTDDSNKRVAVLAALTNRHRWTWFYVEEPGGDAVESIRNSLDARWLDMAVAEEIRELVPVLAKTGHAGAMKLLSKWFKEESAKSKTGYEISDVLPAMVHTNHPEATDAVIAVIEKTAKSTHYYGAYWITRLIPSLPKESLPKLEAWLPTLPEKLFDEVFEYVNQLKSRA